MSEAENRIRQALNVIEDCGGIDGAHHKQWVLDQVVRTLTADEYPAWVADYSKGGKFEWDEGIAP